MGRVFSLFSLSHESFASPSMSEAQQLATSVHRILCDEDDRNDPSIASVAKVDDSSTLLRIKNGSERLCASLRERYPLATVGLCDDLISGSNSIQILFPSPSQRVRIAKEMAKTQPALRVLCRLANLSFFAASVAFAVALFNTL